MGGGFTLEGRSWRTWLQLATGLTLVVATAGQLVVAAMEGTGVAGQDRDLLDFVPFWGLAMGLTAIGWAVQGLVVRLTVTEAHIIVRTGMGRRIVIRRADVTSVRFPYFERQSRRDAWRFPYSASIHLRHRPRPVRVNLSWLREPERAYVRLATPKPATAVPGPA